MKIQEKAFTFNDLVSSDDTESFLASALPFQKLMMQYRCAMLEVQTKFEVFDNELSLYGDRNPIETISCRMKRPVSIVEKLKRKGLDISIQNIQENIFDIAGIRVICSFPEDIYILAGKICQQDDIRLIKKKDYIQSPKANGYRSLHLILEVPVFLRRKRSGCQSKSSSGQSQWIFGQVLNINFDTKRIFPNLSPQIFRRICVNVQRKYTKWICVCKPLTKEWSVQL